MIPHPATTQDELGAAAAAATGTESTLTPSNVRFDGKGSLAKHRLLSREPFQSLHDVI